jgi:predicted dehydrogenase
LDAVLVATPHRTHSQLTLQAFANGLAVFCEKPSAACTKDAALMNRAADVSGKAFAMMFHNRVYPVYQKAKELIVGGEIGSIVKVLWKNTTYFRTECYHHSSPWRSSWEGEGGGFLINQAMHDLDMMQWLCGMPDTIQAQIDYGRYSDIKVDDDTLLWMEYGNGAKGVFYGSTGEPAGELRIEIIGSNAKLLIARDTLSDVDHMEICRYQTALDQFRQSNTDPYGKLPLEKEELDFERERDAYLFMLQNFSDHLRFGTPLIADGRDGLNSLGLANGAYLSSWKERRVRLPIVEDEYVQWLEDKMYNERRRREWE